MNRVLYDLSVCQPYKETKFHGGGIYGIIVFKKLAQFSNAKLAVYIFASRYIDPSVLKLITEKRIEVFDGDKYTIKKAFELSNADVVYSPLYSIHHNNLIQEGVKFVVTIHGLRSIEMMTDTDESAYATSFKMWIKSKLKSSVFNDIIYRRNYNRYKIPLESKNVSVITVSNHSKYSIKCYYPNVDVNRINVFYSPSTSIPEYDKYNVKSKEKYYLIISANRWLKNAGRAIKAFDMLFDNYPNLCENVKVLGLKKNTKIYKLITHKDKFELLGYQTQESLEMLYAGAYAFIYPTLNEGFGYPPLESMKYGVPVISSPFSSIPEICSNAVLYANPYSKEEIANRILQLEQKDIYQFYVNASFERYKHIYQRQICDLDKICNLLMTI